MDAVNIFSVGFSEKKSAFFHYKLLNGMILAERERERESNHRYIMYRDLVCAYIKNHSHNIVFAMLWFFCFRFALL